MESKKMRDRDGLGNKFLTMRKFNHFIQKRSHLGKGCKKGSKNV
jgi:hypothetical protein